VRIALKIDVDTDRGTLEGVPRLASLFERLDVRATFLFSLGPDQTGRAVKRAFRRGFMGKVRRTSVLKHYGLEDLVVRDFVTGPHIARRRGSIMRGIAARGFEVGVHTYNHIKWQDTVARADEAWTRRELVLARDEFCAGVLSSAGDAWRCGLQVNRYVRSSSGSWLPIRVRRSGNWPVHTCGRWLCN